MRIKKIIFVDDQGRKSKLNVPSREYQMIRTDPVNRKELFIECGLIPVDVKFDSVFCFISAPNQDIIEKINKAIIETLKSLK